MENSFEIVEKAIGHVIEIEECIPVWRMPAAFGRDYKRIALYLAANGAECVEMPYARYVDMDWAAELGMGKVAMLISMMTKRWHYYAGMPASKPLPGEGDLRACTLEKRRYARAVHRGPYRKSGETYRALYDWVRGQGLQVDNEAFEFYVNDPRETAVNELETVLLLPLREG